MRRRLGRWSAACLMGAALFFCNLHARAVELEVIEEQLSDEEAQEVEESPVTVIDYSYVTTASESVLTEQLKEDIASVLGEDVQDAIINGYLSLLNKDYILQEELELNLEGIGNGHKLESLAATEITRMVRAAKTEGLSISITSSYRTYYKQAELFKNKIVNLEATGLSHEEAVIEAATVVAVPGTSEHQLGLTADFVTGTYRKLDEGIKETAEYAWISEHSWEYGFIVRYPEDKSELTGIISEPWHLRYVGIPAAKLISAQGICLEEFLGVAYEDQQTGIAYGAGWANTGR